MDPALTFLWIAVPLGAISMYVGYRANKEDSDAVRKRTAELVSMTDEELAQLERRRLARRLAREGF